MIKTIEFKNSAYPAFQASGNAARFARPFAEEICKGTGYDIGCNRPEWALPGAIQIDPLLCDYDAYNLPDGEVDYIHSSHCLEHLPDWVKALEYWMSKIKTGGTLFLYLPHPDQRYWLPWNNRKHLHSFPPDIIRAFLLDHGWINVFVSQRDLNHSFIAIAEKP